MLFGKLPMEKPRVLVLRSPGTNCDIETAFAFEQSGAVAERIHVNRLVENPDLIRDYQILCIPGGFSYGDDLGAGRILAHQMRESLGDALLAFRDSGNCILGICNGFQVLLQTGLLLTDNFGETAQASLTLNDSGHYEDRWVHLQVTASHCIFLNGLQQLYLPVAHAEGKFVVERSIVAAATATIWKCGGDVRVRPNITCRPSCGHWISGESRTARSATWRASATNRDESWGSCLIPNDSCIGRNILAGREKR